MAVALTRRTSSSSWRRTSRADDAVRAYGSAMAVQRPGGTVTFLVTDIEDSTRRWEDAPTDMAAALQVHDAIVRDAIKSHGGYVFATGGDGFSAAFSTAAD